MSRMQRKERMWLRKGEAEAEAAKPVQATRAMLRREGEAQMADWRIRTTRIHKTLQDYSCHIIYTT